MAIKSFEECDHEHARIRGDESIGSIHCETCGKHVHLADVINFWLDRMEQAYNEQQQNTNTVQRKG